MSKILVIEDEEPVLAGITALLEAENFDVMGAENGLSGISKAREYQPDLIICDIMMPKLDGYGVLTQLRQDYSQNMIPFIFLTAKTTRADRRQGMEMGADDFLTKPFTREELLGAIAARFRHQKLTIEHYVIELKQTEEQLNYLIHYDSLTSLPNRLSLQERFHQVVARSAGKSCNTSILSISLDRFSQINDTMGYQVGDLLLKAVAKRLTKCVSDRDTVARLQADRFVIILMTDGKKQTAIDVSQNILSVLSEPFTLGDREVFVTASIGIVIYPPQFLPPKRGPRGGENIDTLVENAAIAMFRAKKQGGNAYKFYTPALHIDCGKRLTLEASLRYALERAEFQVCYQPKVELKTGKIVGVEALIRWKHPEWGFISPDVFIPLAEETGLIVPIGKWVLLTACATTKAWHLAGFSSLRVAVNLSCRQFTQPDLGKNIVEILKKTGLAPEFLELEITESVLMLNEESAIEKLKELRALGIQVSIDDFGTGYSSLSYLRRFPFSNLKIDSSFIRNITIDVKTQTITKAIIQMAHKLNLKVIAEGVEASEEILFLYQHQCDEIQGYFFCHPVPPEEMEKLLSVGKCLKIPSI